MRWAAKAKKTQPKVKTAKAKTVTTDRRLVELVVRSDDEKGEAFVALVSALTGKDFEVTRGSRGARKDGRVIYSVTVAGDKK